MICAYCGRPAATFVMVNGNCYHEECTHGPDWKPQYFTAPCPDCERLRAEAAKLKKERDAIYRAAMTAGVSAMVIQDEVGAALGGEGKP